MMNWVGLFSTIVYSNIDFIFPIRNIIKEIVHVVKF